MRFGPELKRRRIAKGWTQPQLVAEMKLRGHKTTVGNISGIEREYDKDAEGNPTRPGRQLVEAAAKALDWDVNAALTLAGHAPRSPIVKGTPPRNLEEFLRVAEQWGWIDMISLKTKKPIEEFTEEDFAEFWERMRRHFNNELDFKLRDR